MNILRSSVLLCVQTYGQLHCNTYIFVAIRFSHCTYVLCTSRVGGCDAISWYFFPARVFEQTSEVNIRVAKSTRINTLPTTDSQREITTHMILLTTRNVTLHISSIIWCYARKKKNTSWAPRRSDKNKSYVKDDWFTNNTYDFYIRISNRPWVSLTHRRNIFRDFCRYE